MCRRAYIRVISVIERLAFAETLPLYQPSATQFEDEWGH